MRVLARITGAQSWIGQMALEGSSAVVIGVILVSEDRAHRRDLIESLSKSSYTYHLSEIMRRADAIGALRAALEAARGNRPVIVFIDFESVRSQVTGLAAHVRDMKAVMAVECVVTRPPTNASVRERLRALSATLFDQPFEVAMRALLH